MLPSNRHTVVMIALQQCLCLQLIQLRTGQALLQTWHRRATTGEHGSLRARWWRRAGTSLPWQGHCHACLCGCHGLGLCLRTQALLCASGLRSAREVTDGAANHALRSCSSLCSTRRDATRWAEAARGPRCATAAIRAAAKASGELF